MVASGIPNNCFAQEANPFTDLFTFHVDRVLGKRYLTMETDSTPRDPALNERCTAMFNSNEYLFCNYADVYAQGTKLEKMIPDTSAIRARFNAELKADTAFQRLFMRSVRREMVEPLHIDSALRIASHFFYLHRDGEVQSIHICIGINEVKEMSSSLSHPYHAAFCYMAIWAMDDPMELLMQNIAPFRPELKKNNLTDEQLAARELEVYDLMARSPELRKALLDEYDRKSKYLNFELIK